jgi:hypothetical protein
MVSSHGLDIERSAHDLMQLIEESLASGHTRVALQRALMLERLGAAVPEAVRRALRPVAQRLPARELRRMQGAADAWIRMLGVRSW